MCCDKSEKSSYRPNTSCPASTERRSRSVEAEQLALGLALLEHLKKQERLLVEGRVFLDGDEAVGVAVVVVVVR